jgi:hypothetical protein
MPRYIGVTRGEIWRRLRGHHYNVNYNAPQPLYKWMRRELDAGYEIQAFSIEEVDDFKAAQDCERQIILRFRQSTWAAKLLNVSDGGDGNLGWIPSAETRAKLSAAWAHRVVSDETKAKMRAAHLGKKLPPEQIEKMRAANLGKKLSLEHRQKISEARRRAR